MGKGKNKKNAKKRKILTPNQNINIVLPESINKEEMQYIIAKAIVDSESIKEEKVKEQKDKELKEWHNTIGYDKNYSGIKRILNDVKVFFNILFLKEENIDGVTASTLLLKMFLSFFFKSIQVCLFVLSLILIAFIPLQFLIDSITPISWYLNILCFLLSFILFIFSRVFRMAGIEIYKVENYNFLFGLFASITSIISIIIAIIAFVKGI